MIRDAKVKYLNANIKNLKDGDSSKWWRRTKQLIGVSKGSTWFKQLLDNMILQELTERINDIFVSLTADFDPLPVHDSTIEDFIEVPDEFLVSVDDCFNELRSIKLNKSPGPDIFSNRILKEFAYELAPVICNIYNSSMIDGVLLSSLKQCVSSRPFLSAHCRPQLKVIYAQ